MISGGLIFSLQFKPVQTWAAKKATKFLSEELKTKVEIKSIYVKPFKSLVLEGLFILDLEKDTLLSVPELTIDVSYFAPFKERKIDIENIKLVGGKFNLKSYKDTTTNLSFIIKYFSGPVDTTKKKRAFDITFNKVDIENLDLRYRNFRRKSIPIKGTVNYSDIHLKNLSTSVEGLDTKNYLLKAKINKLTFREKSGFYVKNLVSTATIDTASIELKDLNVITERSVLQDYLSMKFSDFKDFSDFNNQVILNGHFKNTKIDSKDIAYFSSALSKMNLSLGVTGRIKGKVNSLRAKDLEVKAGKATYIKGDFFVRGLPDVKNTFLDLKFDQVATNKKDIEYILGKATDKPVKKIPEIVDKFGNVNFAGEFTGYQNDFIAFGVFKTKLGKVKSDINMKINADGLPSYYGNLQAFDFDLGELLEEKSLNRTTFNAEVNGRGIEVKNLTEKLNAKVAYIDFNNYRYKNVAIDGVFDKRYFNGKLNINDPNLKLVFNGGVNLNPKLPVFNFTSTIRNANLMRLKLTKDTILIDADFKTNFSGNNLDNIQGKLALNSIRVTTPQKSFIVDSVYLNADGIGKERLLALQSDIGDASIKGEYDLATLPSAFKTIVKKYIPSLQAKIVRPKNQNFEFNIDLKNFDAVTAFIPELKIPERGVFNGKFESANNLATLNGFVKRLEYQKIVFNNLIVDQTTNPQSLEAIISFDRVDISDSLYVKNIVVQNTLKNDSLTFNVKLSDKNSINQLDLYGLVEFDIDTLFKLSLLPSDVIIDRQVWKIKENVAIKYEENKTIIQGFQLSSNNQLIAINGAISRSADDMLNVDIQDLRLNSLSQLTKGFGVDLAGKMNGSIALSSLLKTPNIKSDVRVDSLKYNETEIGDLQIVSNYNNELKKIEVDANIEKTGKKTMDIAGTIDILSETNNLDLNIDLNSTELIVFEPFVKKLVSKLSGKISSDTKVTGKFKNPQINGTLNLENVGLTVNYLNTAYSINDKVTIDNSIINLDELVIKDRENHVATATGSVNLTNPSTPDILITINAKNFMALNTTEKNNTLYYGTAYGTGVFRFNGPTNAMRINIKAKTEEGTVFTIPLNGASRVGTNDFITYVAKDSIFNTKEKQNYFNGLTMNFDLTVDEKSKVNILTEVGDLSGTGDAQLRLKITSLGDFEMAGDYTINNGKFFFTANNVINKTFSIRKGGNIRWTGNPSEANINLNAVYSTRASLIPLFQAAGRTLPDDRRNERILTEAEMNLTGSLLTPEIDFNLEFPNNTGIKTELQGYLDNKDNEDQQVVSLVVRNSFNGSSGNGIGFTNDDLVGTGLELVFSKINNIISQSLKIKNLDVNLRSKDEFGLSYGIINNRLRFSGNFVNNNYTTGAGDLNNNLFNTSINDLTRDFEMTYNINKDASFNAKAFQRPANRDFFNVNRDNYINGFGLIYSQEYDTFKEFLKNTFGRDRKAEKEKEKQESKKTRAQPITRAQDKERDEE